MRNAGNADPREIGKIVGAIMYSVRNCDETITILFIRHSAMV